MIPGPYKFIGSLVVILLLVTGAYYKGHRDNQAKHNRQILAAMEEHREAEIERQKLAKERDKLKEQLEVLANEDPVVVNECLGPNRVFRLNQLRSTD